MKRFLNSLFVLGMIFLLTGCGKEKLTPNQTMGKLQYYISDEFTYQPELRGLLYSENNRRIYTKGDYNDRSEAIIIDVISMNVSKSIGEYLNDLNGYIMNDDEKYKKVSDQPVIYLRNKYQGRSADIVIYNYTYALESDGVLYTFTISGPSTKEEELNNINKTIAPLFKIS